MPVVQTQNPVRWKSTASRISDQIFEIRLDISIQPGWHIFSLDNVSGPGPINIKIEKEPGMKLEGAVKQIGHSKIIQDSVFKTRVRVFSDKASFVQRISRKKEELESVNGTIRYIACNGKNCLAPKTDSFRVALP